MASNPARPLVDGDAVVQCDGCGAHGRRRAEHPSPDFWFYLESINRTPGEEDHVYIVWACSEACRDAMWKRGPGPRVIDEQREVHHGG